MAGSTSAVKPEQTLTTLASLLSSAWTAGGEQPLAGSSAALPCFVSSVVPPSGPGSVCASLPSLSLKNRELPDAAKATAGMSLEESAAFHLAIPLLCTRADLPDAPSRMLRNMSESFAKLIDARLRSSLAALLRQTIAASRGAGGRGDGRTRLVLGMLNSSPITPTTVVTNLRVPTVGERKVGSGGGGAVLPLVYEAFVDLTVMGTVITVNLRSPGTIAGTFASPAQGGDGLLKTVEVSFDTIAFLQAMMKQARFAVRKAVAVASGIAATLVSTGILGNSSNQAFVKTVPTSTFQRRSSAGTAAKERDELPQSITLMQSHSASLNSLDSKSNEEGEGGLGDDAMPPPPPRRPLHPSRSSPGLRHSSYGRKVSSGSLSSSSSTSTSASGPGNPRNLSGGMPTGSPTSELGPILGCAGSDQETNSNAEWDNVDSSSAAAQGLALLGKVSLGLKRVRYAVDNQEQALGTPQTQEDESESKRDEGEGPNKKRKGLPLRKRRVLSCPSIA